MDAKQYLRQVKYLDELVAVKLGEVEELRSLAEKVTSAPRLDSVQPSGTQDRIADLVAKIVALETEINQTVDRMMDMKAEATRLIDSMPTPEHQILLRLRCFRGCTWEEIAVKMGYTYRGIHYLHSRALIEFNQVRTKTFHCFA
jgi:DNA-directed RNA polymerase specialized sigma24 family protein